MNRGDSLFVERAIELARKGIGHTSPNPSVGAVIVKNGRIIGEGFHRKAGLPHAEIEAINNCKDSPEGATMYVTLEPCVHFGKTPPCVDAIIKSGIKRVVVCEKDPNPIVNGKGISRLRERRIKVDMYDTKGVVRSINCGFNKWIVEKKPYVIVKIASTLDGKIADRSGDSKYLTGESIRRAVHKMRYRSDAILVGAQTVIKDDPLLDCRLFIQTSSKKPARVVVDGNMRLNPEYRIFREDGALRIILTSKTAYDRKIRLLKRFESIGVQVVPFRTRDGVILIKDILEYLGSMNILYMLVEGGQRVFTDFIDSKEADLLVMNMSPRVFGAGGIGFYSGDREYKFSQLHYLPYESMIFDRDVLISYYREGSDVYGIDRSYSLD